MNGVITKPAHEIRLADELRLTVERVIETPEGLIFVDTDVGWVGFKRRDTWVRTYREDD